MGKKWTLPLLDVGDGSGDKLVQLPHEFLDALGRPVAHDLELTRPENGELWLRRAVTNLAASQ